MTEEKKKQENETLDDKQYQSPTMKDAKAPNQPTLEQQKEMQKSREELESLKKFICSKYKFVNAIGIIPPQAANIFDEENELTEKEKKEKPMHLLVVLSDDKGKEFNNVKLAILDKIKETKQKTLGSGKTIGFIQP